MPIYEYRCESCGHELEAMQRMSDAPLTECPACGKPALKKQVSAAGFRLSGGGWYETDFKKDGKRNIAAKDGGGDSKPSGCSTCAASDGGT
jgi:putative FmdB family regulatory protein